jgi:cytochrome c biogenesis protein CcmG, thiol:disulfide interchange protein DsbE
MWRNMFGVIFALIVTVMLFSTYKKATRLGGNELVGKPAPNLTISALEGFPALPKDGSAFGKGYVMINFFASWCQPCQAEHPFLKQLAAEYNLPIVGVVWRDSGANVKEMLQSHGNPYAYVGTDIMDASAYSYGVKGLPESFLINAQGKVVATYRGPITPPVMQEIFAPHLEGKSQ